MTEYPRKCTIQEAIDCMLAGGKASARRRSDPIDHWGWFDAAIGYDDGYEYRIDVPPVVKRVYSTVEAIAELYKHGPGGD